MILDDIATYLQTQAVGTIGTDLFKGLLPENDGNFVLIKQTGGVEPDKYLPIAQPTIQVMVGNSDYLTGHNKIEQIKSLFHRKLDNFSLKVGGVDVMSIFATQEPAHVGIDENNRHVFICNFVFKLRES